MNYEHYNILIRKSQPPKLIYFVDNPVNNKRDTSGDWEVTPGLRELTQLPPSRESWVNGCFPGVLELETCNPGREPGFLKRDGRKNGGFPPIITVICPAGALVV